MKKLQFNITFRLLFLYSISNANDSNLGSESGSVFPIGHNTIQMISENIRVTFTLDSIICECRFVFFNHGKRASALMGFPEKMCDEGDIEAIRGFRTVVNNKDIPIKRAENKKNASCEDSNIVSSWYTWNLTFDEMDSLEVRNCYSGEFGTNVSGLIFYYYTIGTGKTWHKDITKGTITFIHGGIASSLFRVIPEKNEYLSSGINIEEHEDSVSFYFNNFEPNYDQKIGIELIGFFYKPVKNSLLDNDTKRLIRAMNYSKSQYRLMRNEIFARNGFIFSNIELARHFSSKTWYSPKSAFKIHSLSLFEKELVKEIILNEKLPPKKK